MDTKDMLSSYYNVKCYYNANDYIYVNVYFSKWLFVAIIWLTFVRIDTISSYCYTV